MGEFKVIIMISLDEYCPNDNFSNYVLVIFPIFLTNTEKSIPLRIEGLGSKRPLVNISLVLNNGVVYKGNVEEVQGSLLILHQLSCYRNDENYFLENISNLEASYLSSDPFTANSSKFEYTTYYR